MARRSKPERVLGPYRHYRRWRVLLVSAGGEKTVTDYESEEEDVEDVEEEQNLSITKPPRCEPP